MADKKMGVTITGVVAAVKATAKGHFIGISTGESVVSVFRPAASIIPIPGLMKEVQWDISIGNSGFVSVLG